MLKISFYTLCFLIFLFSCSSPEKEKDQVQNQMAEKAEESMEERKSKGDTLALSPHVLTKAFPESVLGYVKAGEVVTYEDKTIGSNWSSASQTYNKANRSIEVTITDYNGAYGLFAGAKAIFSNSPVLDGGKEVSRPYEDKKLKGWETFNRETKEGSLILASNDRFLITLEGEGVESPEELREFWKKIELIKVLE